MRPHAGQLVVTQGPELGKGRGVVIMVHGRHASAANILELAPHFEQPDLTFLAPAAANSTWYPHSFMAEIPRNEPGISSGVHVVADLIRRAADAGVPAERVVLLGFSQGACLAAETSVRHPARYGGVVVFSGGLIGPPGTTWPATGSFDETPVFLGCSDADAHIPEARVHESAEVFTRLGADVTTRIYPGMGHLVADDEIEFARRVLDRVGA